MKDKELLQIIQYNNIIDKEGLFQYIEKNIDNLSIEDCSFIFEKGKHFLLKSKSKDEGVFFTRNEIAEEVIQGLPDFKNKRELNILEPSVGIGGFLNAIIKKYGHIKKVNLYINDIDDIGLRIIKVLIKSKKIFVPDNFIIHYLNKDFLTHNFDLHFDIIIGNPPYSKTNDKDKVKLYKELFNNKKTNNLFAFFIEKAIKIADFVALIIPKSLLFVNEFSILRDKLRNNLDIIIDYNKKAFNVNIETISFIFNKNKNNKNLFIKNYKDNTIQSSNIDYALNKDFPIWLIYRNDFFDKMIKRIKLNSFISFRDRQITNKMLKDSGEIQVLRGRNIIKNGISNINGYDKFIKKENIENGKLQVVKFLQDNIGDNILCAPNLTNNIRFCLLPKGYIANGAVALLKSKEKIQEKDLTFLNSKDFYDYFQIIKNKSELTVNIDKNISYFIGLLKK